MAASCYFAAATCTRNNRGVKRERTDGDSHDGEHDGEHGDGAYVGGDRGEVRGPRGGARLEDFRLPVEAKRSRRPFLTSL
jgi:hypothetical protein